MTDVNRHLARDVDGTNRFMSMFYGEIDAARRRICWTRAGHDPALIFTPGADTVEELAGPGFPLPLGVMKTAPYEESRHAIEPGQVIVIGTDGIWEAFNKKGAMFGKKRFKDIIRQNAAAGADDILNAVYNEINQFIEGQKTEDDITLVIVKVNKP